MAELVTNVELTEKEKGEVIVASVGMIVALISFGMLFATLMLGFAMFRLTAPVWPPAGMMKPSLMLPSLSTFFIAASSASFIWFEKNLADKRWLLLTILLGLVFMTTQGLLWHSLKSQGILVSSGIFPSIIYAFTWIHAAHIVAALGLLVWLYLRGLYAPAAKAILRTNTAGKFWHFLGIVWFIMFVTMFVL